MAVTARFGARALVIACGLQLSLAACAPGDQDRAAAIRAVNNEFRRLYEDEILPEIGTRTFNVRRNEAFADMRVVLAGIGMRTESQDSSLGILRVSAAAPLPLNVAEWDMATKVDQPMLQKIIEPYVGALAASTVQFEPKGLDTVINLTFVETPNGTEISMTGRLREVAPPKSGWPRREYLPPAAMKMGINKIWGAFAQELKAGPQQP